MTASSTPPAGRGSSGSASTASLYDLAEAPTLDKYQPPFDRGRRRSLHRPPRGGAGRRRTGRGRPADRAGDRDARPRPGCGSARGLGRDGPAARRGRHGGRAVTAGRRTAGLRGAPVQRAVQLPVRRHDDRRARAAQLLVQLAPWRMPRLHGPRDPARDRPGPRRPRQEPVGRAGRTHAPWARMPMADSWFGKVVEAVCRVSRLGCGHSDPRPGARGARLPAARAARRAGPSSATGTITARTRTRRRSRGSSPISSAATRRRTPST